MTQPHSATFLPGAKKKKKNNIAGVITLKYNNYLSTVEYNSGAKRQPGHYDRAYLGGHHLLRDTAIESNCVQ
jgi:hypothetical protein